MTLELRSLMEPPEFRSKGTLITATGIAIKYGAVSTYEIKPGIVEEIRSGAVTKTMNEGDPLMLHEHRRDLYLGRKSNGTLRLEDTPTELRYEVDLPDTTTGRDVATMLERRDVRGSSVGMDVDASKTRWSRTEKGLALRSVGELRLGHISTTCAPIYDSSTAELALRSLAEATGTTLEDVIDASRNGHVGELFDTKPPETDPELASLVGLEGLTKPQIEALASMAAAEGTVIHRRPAAWFV